MFVQGRVEQLEHFTVRPELVEGRIAWFDRLTMIGLGWASNSAYDYKLS
jgi:hypothetical protein